MNKKWYTSKTIWFNIVLGIVGVIEVNSAALQQALSPTMYGFGIVTISTVGVVLRAITTSAVKDTK